MNDTYIQTERTYSDDGWRATWYEGPDGHRVSVAMPPRQHFADYGNGKVFLDHLSYDEEGEQSMLVSLISSAALNKEESA